MERHDRVNVNAFGPDAARYGWGVDPFYGGTPTTFPGEPGTPRTPNDFALGDTPTDAPVAITITPSWGAILGGYAAMSAGGALTGYLAAGTQRGALTGALVHVSLFSFGSALAARGRLDTPYLVGFAGVGLAAAAGVAYLFMRRRRG